MLEFLAIQPQFIVIPSITAALFLLGALWFWPGNKYFGDHALAGFGGYSMTGVRQFGIGWWVVATIMLVINILMLMPYNSKYHVFYTLSGTLSVDTNTFEEGTGTLSGPSVFYVDGYDDPIVSSSSRLMVLDGRDVDLLCSIEWNPYALDITRCELKAIN